MTFLYLDASAWVKRYYQERGSHRLEQLLASNEARACSVLGVVEVVATLARKAKAREITRKDFEAKAAEIDRDWRTFIQIELTLEAVKDAREAAAEFTLRGADAVHLAAVRLLHQRLTSTGHRVILVASDRELKEAALTLAIPVIDPDVDPAVT